VSPEATPILKVIDAHATPEEIAAIVTVLSAMGGGAPAPRPPRSQWAHPARQIRTALGHGRGGWRASAQPR
jgi:hypothetical protein